MGDSKREAVAAIIRSYVDSTGTGGNAVPLHVALDMAKRILAAVEPRVLDEQVCYVDDFGQVMATFMNRDPAHPLPHNTRRRVALVDLGEVGT